FNAELIEFGGEEEHVHLLVLVLPKFSIFKIVFRIKGTSSITIRKRKYPTVRTKLRSNALWTLSFFPHSAEVLRYYSAIY
ncbi:transposase, partial [uncultured Succinatimonas sp.]